MEKQPSDKALQPNNAIAGPYWLGAPHAGYMFRVKPPLSRMSAAKSRKVKRVFCSG